MNKCLIIFDFNRTLYCPEKQQLVDGAIAIIKALKLSGHRTSIVSSEMRDADRTEKISELGLNLLADKVVIIEGNDKKEAFVECMEEFNTVAENCFVVGDYQEYDLLPARKLEFRTIWYRQGKFSDTFYPNFIPEFTISKLNQITKIINIKFQTT